MKRSLMLIIGVVFALALLARAVTYTVRFTEAAVVTTFGRAAALDPQRVHESGLKFKWPDPIQSVTKYDTRSRFLQTRSETQQTADARQIVVEAFCTWRVSDPLKFFQRFSNAGDRAEDHFAQAEEMLRRILRSALGEVSRYRMDELFTTQPGASRLEELEARVLGVVRSGGQAGGSLDDLGVEVQMVGINRVVLPEDVTRAVFESMRQDRDRLVKALESKGISEAEAITSRAQADARRIEEFARAYAAEIRKEGDREAERYVAQMNQYPELAVFLKYIEFISKLDARRITFVFDPANPGFELMSPANVRAWRNGQLPGVLEGGPGGSADSPVGHAATPGGPGAEREPGGTRPSRPEVNP